MDYICVVRINFMLITISALHRIVLFNSLICLQMVRPI